MADQLCICGHLMSDHFCDAGVCLVADCPCLGFEDLDEEVDEAEAELATEDRRMYREGWDKSLGFE
jgi:hypothetical protein